MKLSFSSIGCPQWSFEQMVENARKLGFDAIELRGVQTQLRTEKLACMQPENRAATRELLAANKVSLCGVGTSVCFHDAVAYWDALQEGRRALELCTEMKIPFIRVFGNVFPEGEEKSKVVARVVEGLTALCEYAKMLQPLQPVQVLLEVHGDFNSLQPLKQVCDAMKHTEEFGLIWDVGNSYSSHGADFMPFYMELNAFVRHVHIKDFTQENKKDLPCLVGQGVLPLDSMIHGLLESGYNGYFSFEWEKRWHPELQEAEQAFPYYIDFMKQFKR